MPGFEKIYQSFGDRMDVIAVNAGVGDDAAKVKAFAQEAGMHMPLAIDDGALGAWIKLRATPLHIIIGRDGRVFYTGHQDGPRLDAAKVKPLFVIASFTPGDIRRSERSRSTFTTCRTDMWRTAFPSTLRRLLTLAKS